MAITDTIRVQCAWVADRARSATINTDRVEPYAAALADELPVSDTSRQPDHDREAVAAYWLTLNAINFGSGWFPTLRKEPGATGYRTISRGVQHQFQHHGPWSAADLGVIGATELATVLHQDPQHELLALFAASLRDLGNRLMNTYDGSFAAVADGAAGSAVALVETLSRWECFADTSDYDGREVPFLKRAQLAAADLHRAGVARLTDMDELTMFADNLVPHVMRLDGLLTFAPDLVQRIERGELLEHGAREEVEIRACAVHAVELVVGASRPGTTAAQVDELLWNRGQGRQYKARPRHRSRTTAY